MKKMFLVFIAIFSLTAMQAFSQDCKVLVPELEGEYVGDCNKGLAHGNGKATGVDTYEGSFNQGLPHGQGTYTWASGKVYEGRWRKGKQHGIGKLKYMQNDKEVVVEGVWNNGELKSQDSSGGAGYTVISMRRMDSVRAIQIGEGASIIFKITRYGTPLVYSDMSYSGSSGQPRRIGDEIRFDNVNFPFKASLRYVVQNKMRTDQFQCELEISIEEAGTWEVITQQ